MGALLKYHSGGEGLGGGGGGGGGGCCFQGWELKKIFFFIVLDFIDLY